MTYPIETTHLYVTCFDMDDMCGSAALLVGKLSTIRHPETQEIVPLTEVSLLEHTEYDYYGEGSTRYLQVWIPRLEEDAASKRQDYDDEVARRKAAQVKQRAIVDARDLARLQKAYPEKFKS